MDQVCDLVRSAIPRMAVFGMGRVGVGAYEQLRSQVGEQVVGIDSDPEVVARHIEAGRHVILADAQDRTLWEHASTATAIDVILLTMSNHDANLRVCGEIASARAANPELTPVIGAAARFTGDALELREAGVDVVLDFYEDAGSGVASQLLDRMGKARANGP